ncbi:MULTISPECIES: hypothetical protein [unclassified Ectothiorhodospira]|uniref:hypothetical protein n=1 Tax=unclassified Ectothiorhodospira TaxID=2684909 RepID=UPI001EE8A93E|nr:MULTISPECIES: hypothetical protein [unclassified Ectothiorhodospira]MCG5517219.1 hypothetical protein [Ectothiorhodospira sp. 9100]MCG5519952.1 hypothetical protein [Ectothiorhodospira sp. 9905]
MQTITRVFHDVAKLKRDDIFADQALTPITALDDARTPAPGWVGPSYHPGGIVFIGVNPGGGGDAYRRNPTDNLLYEKLRAFRDASPSSVSSAFEEVNKAWMSIQKTHSIWRVINAALQAARVDVNTVSFINMLPFRTREDKLPDVSTMERAWQLAARKQIQALQPGAVVCLGYKATHALERFGRHDHLPRTFSLKRARGDTRITEEARQVLAEFRDWSESRHHGD